MTKMIITVLGKDRPGIIARITTLLFTLSCNLENVNQMILQDQFAGFFIVEPPPGLAEDQIRETLETKTRESGLTIHVNPVQGNGSPGDTGEAEMFLITTIGPDQKGLVAKFSTILAQFNANIIHLKAVFKGGIDPSANVMSYQVSIPFDTDTQALFQQLRKTAATLDLDVRIQHKNIFDAIHKI